MFVPCCLRLILSDVWSPSSFHHFLLEFLGTALFLSVSLLAVLMLPSNQVNLSNQRNLIDPGNLSNRGSQSNPGTLQPPVPFSPAPPPLQVSLMFGFSVAVAAVCMGGDAHLNPAVTVAMVLTLRLRPWGAALRVIGQLLGGMASAALLQGLMGDVAPALNQVSPGVRLHQAVAVEMLVTFQLVLVIVATVSLPTAALMVGLSVTLGHLVSATGCGMNPARSFGPAFVTLDFTDHWVFWAGPCLGACLAVLLNDLLLRPCWRCHRDKQQQVELTHLP